MGYRMAAAKGAALGILYAVVAAPPFALVYFGRHGWELMPLLLLLVACCAVPAGTAVGLTIQATGAHRQGEAWRAQLGMLGIYVLTGLVYFSQDGEPRIREGLESALNFAPVFVPLGLLATWAAIRWLRRGSEAHWEGARRAAL